MDWRIEKHVHICIIIMFVQIVLAGLKRKGNRIMKKTISSTLGCYNSRMRKTITRTHRGTERTLA